LGDNRVQHPPFGHPRAVSQLKLMRTVDRTAKHTQWRLACFDLDGTLVRGTTICQHLGDFFGHGAVVRDLARAYAIGRIGFRELAEKDAEFYRGRSTRHIASALESLPLIMGIEQTMSRLRENRLKVLLTTITWSFAARIIAQRFRLDGWSGTIMGETNEGLLSGSVELHFDEFAKRRFVENYCLNGGISLNNVFAVGDSTSDIPLFEVVGHSIALNATDLARKTSSCSLDTDNLLDVLGSVPGLGL
jgi:phosphoserine phosphatase